MVCLIWKAENVCRLQNLCTSMFTCMCFRADVLLCIPLHACIMDVCTFAHSYSCSHVHIVFIYVSVAHICACVSAYIWGSLYVCRLGHIYACVCVWSRSDFYLYQSCIISSLFKHCLLCMSWNKIQFCVCKVSFFPISKKTKRRKENTSKISRLHQVRSPTIHCCSPPR